MKKEYLKPEVLMISLLVPERIATEDEDGIIGGEPGVESSIFG